MEPVIRPAARSLPAGMVEGFFTPLDGFHYLNSHPRLWRFAVLPVLLNVLITLLVLGMLFYAGMWGLEYLEPRLPAGWLGTLAKFASGVIFFVLALALAAGAWLLLGGILCGYFFSRLALQVELQLGASRAELNEVSLLYQAVDVLRDFASLALVNLFCLLLNILPGIGSTVGAGVALYFDGFILGYEYLDFPLALRGLRRREKLAFAKHHRGQTLGLGWAVLLMNFVPLLGAIGLASAAAGAVILHRRMLAGVAVLPGSSTD